MKTLFLGILVFVLFIFSSCSEETTHSRTSFPDIRVYEYAFRSEQKYIFYLATSFEIEIVDFDENMIYSYNNILFQGWANTDEIQLSDNKIKTDIRDYLYNKYPDHIENPVADFIREYLEGIKIYSNKDFNEIKAGDPLNHYFEIITRLVVLDKDKYRVSDGDISDKHSFKNSFVPLRLKIKLKSPPQKADKYDFFLEVKTDKRIFTSKVISISLNESSSKQ